jgi:UDP:flavonoid glycosyltransferase YjiC (YdhE family)
MKKFLFTSLISNDLGLITRSLPIARELRDRGHQVMFCHSGKAQHATISAAGFEILPFEGPLYYLITGNLSLPVLYRVFRSGYLKRDVGYLVSFIKNENRFSTAEIWNIDHFEFLMGAFHAGMVRHAVDTWMGVIRAYNPDAVVDFWNSGACIAARACGKPLITVIQAEMHPQSRGFIWWREPPDDIPSPVTVINQIRAEHHLHPIENAGELFVGDKTLVVGMPETDPLSDTASVTYIGPVIWQREHERLPDWFLDLSTSKPVIWLYPGNPQYVRGTRSWGDSSGVTSACIAALKDKPVQVVFSGGHHPLPKGSRSLPPNFRYVSYVPGLDMAARSDLMIHHGSYGSCQTGLFTGTPLLVIPTYSERESNARRVAALGAGDFVLPTSDATGRNKQVNAAEVSEKVDRILSDLSFKKNAKRISQKLRTYGGASYAASLIEGAV